MLNEKLAFKKIWGDGNGVGWSFGGMNVLSSTGTLKYTTTNSDPMINMYNLGSFDPNKYKFIQVKYRVVSGSAGSVEVFFTNSQYLVATGGISKRAVLKSDGNWNVVTVAMHTHANWTDSNITGWRLDMGTVSGVTIEMEWVRLVGDEQVLKIDNNVNVSEISEVGITNGLVAYYPLNKDAKDYSGNGYHGTVNGAVLTGGGYDGTGAYRFDGVDDYIRCTVTPMNPTNHTISGWFLKRAHTMTSYPIFLSYGLPYIACSGSSSPFRISYTGSSQINTSGGIVPDLNTWYHVCAVFASNGVSLYVNGILQSVNNTLCTNTSATFDFGRHLNSNTYATNGDICNVKIFNRALSAEEIAVEYKRTGPTKMTQHNGTVYIQGQIKEV